MVTNMILYSMHHISTQQSRQEFHTGRLRPEVQLLTLLYTIFGRKRTPFVYLLLTNGAPFTGHIFPTLELSISSNYCKCTFFKVWMNLKLECFLNIFTAIKCVCYFFWVFFWTKMTEFPALSYTSTSEIRNLSYTSTEAYKRYPFQTEPPCMGHYSEYPLPLKYSLCFYVS